MKRVGKWLGVLVALIAACVVMYRISYPSVTVRYRLVIEAVVDGKPQAGSSVIEVTYHKQSRFAGQNPVIIDTRGQAVILELGLRGTLFALLVPGADIRSGPESIILRAFDFPSGVLPNSVDEGLKQIRGLSGKRELPLTSLPLLVGFRDLNDPKTVERVDPLDISKSFGEGTKLTRATLEIVSAGIWPFSWFGVSSEPLTNTIEGKLKWLGGYYDKKFDGSRYETNKSSLRFANTLNAGAFKAGH